jgi:hypothetical protein
MIQPLLIRQILLPGYTCSRNCQSGIPQQVPDTSISHISAGSYPCPWLVSDPGGVGHDKGVYAGCIPAVEIFTLIEIFVGVELVVVSTRAHLESWV